MKNLEKEFAAIAKRSDEIELKLQTEKSERNIQALQKEFEQLEIKGKEVHDKIEQLRINPQNTPEARQLQNQIDLMNSKLDNTKRITDDLNQDWKEIQKTLGKNSGANNVANGFEQIGNKVEKLRSRMTKLVLGAFIFNVIRSGLSKLSQGLFSALSSNEQFINSLNQIKANLLTAFTPIFNACLPAINTLMNALARITGTIAVFVSSLFGQSINQSKENAKALYNQSKAYKAVGKSAKDAGNNVASFDKLEVLSDSASSGGPDNGINFDGELTYSQKLLDLLTKIKDFVVGNKEEILGLLAGVATGLALVKLGFDPIMALGIGLMVAGLVYAVQGLLDYLKEPTWENFGKIIQGIGVAVIGLGLLIGGSVGLTVIIAGTCALILGTIIKYWEQIKTFLQNGIDWLSGKSEWVHDVFGDTIGDIYDFFVGTLQRGLDWLNIVFTTMKNIFDGIIQFVKGVFTGNWKQAWEGVKKIFSSIWDGITKTFSLFLEGIFNKVGVIGSTVGNIIAGTFRAVVNAVLSKIESVLNSPIRTINSLVGVINKVPGINLGKLSTFNLPRLATGAVIPPNAQFAAILGDQRNGKNLEAPESLIRKIVREESGEKDVVLNATFIVQCDDIELGKASLKGLRLMEEKNGKKYLVN